MSLRSPTEDENRGISLHPNPIFKGGHEEHEVMIKNFRTLRGLRELRGENLFRQCCIHDE
jgi:hypothetical protein